MQNHIECMLAENRSLGLVGRFLHRYEKCQTALASHADDNALTDIRAGGGERPAAGGGATERSHMERNVGIGAEKIEDFQWSPRVSSASRYMTIFLDAYVAARQVSAKSGSQAADK